MTEAGCVIGVNAACVEHSGAHNMCIAHLRCISSCWPKSAPTYDQLEAEVRRLREALGLQLVGHQRGCACTACAVLKEGSAT